MTKKANRINYNDTVSVIELSPDMYVRKIPATKGINVLTLSVPTRRKYLDETEVFYNWLRLGSSGELYRYYVSEGIISPHTNKPPTEQALLCAVFRYISVNYENAMSEIKKSYENAHEIYDEDAINISLIDKIDIFLGNRYFLKFVIEHRLYEKYFNDFPKRYGYGEKEYNWMVQSGGDFDTYRVLSGTAPRRLLERIGYLRSKSVQPDVS